MSGTVNRWMQLIKPLRRKRATAWQQLQEDRELSFERRELQMDEHLISIEELSKRLDTNLLTGLRHDQIKIRQHRDGRNELTSPTTQSEILKFIGTLFSGFGILLIIGGLVSIGAWLLSRSHGSDNSNDNLWLGTALLAVALATAALQYYQELKTSKIMESFGDMIPQFAYVMRQGVWCSIRTQELVVGDVVELKGGDTIPADIRIIESRGFKVDNSLLTGESEFQVRVARTTSDSPWETKNLVFSSTHAVEGSAMGVVLRTGDKTLVGTIASITSSVHSERAPIALELERFIRIISAVAFFWGCLTLLFCLINEYPLIDSLLYFISTVVANVPEGLLATVTVLLALTAKRMARKNCLIRRLEAIETLGSTNVICTDKTGTLTQNRMTVAHYWLNDCIVEADMSSEQMDLPPRQCDEKVTPMLRTIILCNKAEFKAGQEGDVPVLKRECTGNASDVALLKYAQIATGRVGAIRSSHKKLCEIPFNSVDKVHISVHHSTVDGNLVLMKGAPETILARCATFLKDGEEYEVTKDFEELFNTVYLSLGGAGERVLGLCDLHLPGDQYPIGFQFDSEALNFPTSGMRFVGLISLVDPPRPGAPDAVAKCRSANIKVVMVTGDHPITAKAVARSVGIFAEHSETVEDVAIRRGLPLDMIHPSEANACVVHGSDLRRMDMQQLSDLICQYAEIIFARTSPQQKLLIVETYQRLGYTVAVTGDGVNDSPALKKANIGIAMGITGCDVTKQTADVILMDDNFASIVTGVEEGRLIFDNMKKAITYVLASNIPELLPFILHILLNIPLALGTAAILCIDLGTDIWPDISLACEEAEGDLMRRQARNKNKDRLVNARMISFSYGQIGLIEAAGAFMAYLVVMNDNGFSPSRLLGIRRSWIDTAYNVEDSYGQEWTYGQRKMLESTCHTAFFASIVVMQWANLICSKTRRNSIIQQGMKNRWLNFGLLFETAAAALLIYCPGIGPALSLQPIRLQWWWPSVPFAVVIFVYDELRKCLLRRSRGFWFEKELNF